MEEAADGDAATIRELAMRVQVLEDRVAALASHDKPSVPWEADEQAPYREGQYEYDHYGWVL